MARNQRLIAVCLTALAVSLLLIGVVNATLLRDRNRAKFWADPARLQESGGFRRPEIERIERLVAEHQTALLRAWHGFFGT